MSQDFGYSNLRNRLSSSSVPLMPLLPLYYSDLGFYDSLGDLITAEEDSETKWINVEKLVGVAKTVLDIKKFQACDYQFQQVQSIQEHILKYPVLMPKEAEDTAVRLEMLNQ